MPIVMKSGKTLIPNQVLHLMGNCSCSKNLALRMRQNNAGMNYVFALKTMPQITRM